MGIVIPPIGIAAAIGVIFFFVGAIITHVRARWFSFGFPAIYLLLAVGALVMGLVRPYLTQLTMPQLRARPDRSDRICL